MGSSSSSRQASRAVTWGVMIVILGFLLQEAEARPASTRSTTSAPTQPTSIQMVVDGSKPIATVGDEFICATLDWWPPSKCDYGSCSWHNVSMLNLDLTNPILGNAVEALAPLKIRLGGTLQDIIEYDIGALLEPCVPPLVPNSLAPFGFAGGCLTMHRWDLLNQFLKKTGASVAFGLNALYGQASNGTWDPSNAAEFILYTHDQGYPVTAWELGNELLGEGGGGITPRNYSDDVKMLRTIVNLVYEHDSVKPLVVAPDSFYEVGNPDYGNVLADSGPYVLDVVTRHLYNLGPGSTNTDELVGTILNRVNGKGEEDKYAGLQTVLTDYPWACAWVGEAGGAYNSGHENVTDSFIMAFWYLDQLGLASKHNNQAFCRQSLIGGHYGLLDAVTYLPNPDFYGALLWQELMGNNVLSVNINSTDIQAYAHCQKKSTKKTNIKVGRRSLSIYSEFGTTQCCLGGSAGRVVFVPATIHQLDAIVVAPTCREGGVTVLLLNYSNETSYSVNLTVLNQTSEDPLLQLEYHMSPEGGDIHSHVVLLNGNPLLPLPRGVIPKIEGLAVNGSTPVTLEPLTYVFVVLQGSSAAACLKS